MKLMGKLGKYTVWTKACMVSNFVLYQIYIYKFVSFCNNLGCPPEWDPMPLDQTNREVRCHLVSLQPSSPEYKRVLDAFSKTMKSCKQVVQIQRIQNPALYHQYISMRTDMDKNNAPNHKNERKLFHGTASS